MRKVLTIMTCLVLTMMILAGCSKNDKSSEPEIGVIVTDKGSEMSADELMPESEGAVGMPDELQEVPEEGLPIGANISELPDADLEAAGIFVDESTDDVNAEQTDLQAEINANAEQTGMQTATAERSEAFGNSNTSADTIVWLGDSLTQGSLGHDKDNIGNAPYVKLAKLSGRVIEGYGYYGYKTHDIFWVYVDEEHENQKKDSNKTYVFWVGSNDWVVDGKTNDNADSVIGEIDSFVSGGNITKYIVLGTTARYELRKDYKENNGTDLYQSINDKLKEHYGDKYLDVNTVISIEDGYGPDNIHLTQESYDAVAELVNKKIDDMGW